MRPMRLFGLLLLLVASPAWATAPNPTAGHWVQVTGLSLPYYTDGSGHTVDQVNGASGVNALPYATYSCWTSGLVDNKRETYVALNTGGHSCTMDNSSFWVDIMGNLPGGETAVASNGGPQAWSRLNNPSAYGELVPSNGASWYTDGKPATTHSYNCVQHMLGDNGEIDRYWLTGGNRTDGNTFVGTGEYNPVTKSWAQTEASSQWGSRCMSIWDSARQRIVLYNGFHLYSYTPASTPGTPTSYVQMDNWLDGAGYVGGDGEQHAVTYDSKRGRMWVLLGNFCGNQPTLLYVQFNSDGTVALNPPGDSRGNFWVDVSSSVTWSNFPNEDCNASGSEHNFWRAPGFFYDKLRDRLVFYKSVSKSGGGTTANTLYYMDPATLTVTNEAMTGMTAQSQGNGIWGRMRHLVKEDLYVLLAGNGIDANAGVWAYRPSALGLPPPRRWIHRAHPGIGAGFLSQGKHGRLAYRAAGHGINAGLIGGGGDYHDGSGDDTGAYDTPLTWLYEVLSNTHTKLVDMRVPTFATGPQPARGCTVPIIIDSFRDVMYLGNPYQDPPTGFNFTGHSTAGSPVVTGLVDLAGWVTSGLWIQSGGNVAQATTIVSVDSSTQITMSANASQTGTFQFMIAPPRGGWAMPFATMAWHGPDTDFPPPGGGWGGDTTTIYEHGVYDPTSDDIIENGTTGLIRRFHIPTKVWTEFTLPNGGSNTGRSDIDIDVANRTVYLVDQYAGAGPTLIKYNIDTGTDTRILLPSQWTNLGDQSIEAPLKVDTVNKVVLIPAGTLHATQQITGMAIYHTDTGVMEWDPANTTIDGVPIAFSTLGFDQNAGVFVAFGDRVNSSPGEIFLYQYGANGGSSGPPPGSGGISVSGGVRFTNGVQLKVQ